jgi:hypothetical protein
MTGFATWNSRNESGAPGLKIALIRLIFWSSYHFFCITTWVRVIISPLSLYPVSREAGYHGTRLRYPRILLLERGEARQVIGFAIKGVTGVTWIRPSPVRLAMLWVKGGLRRRSVTLLPPLPEGLRLNVGAGQVLLEGYENLDGYNNTQRPRFFQTAVRKFVRAEVLDLVYDPSSVAEIRCHHLFEHISILDLDRTLRGWNRIMKSGALLWIEVPDFEGCVRKILSLKREADKEIFYRHIFGSQVGPGEFHRNGFTASRLIGLLHDYGFQTEVAYIRWLRRQPRKPDMYYPSDVPLPDLTVKAIKVGPPNPALDSMEFTHTAYRRHYPDPELEE